jgi:outer membrane PBP1 activator LpoA protein
MKNRIKIIASICITSMAVLTISSCTKKKPEVPTQLSANQYLDMANQAAPQDKPMYELAAANKYISQQKPELARNVLNSIPNNATPEQGVQKQFLQAKVALLDDQAQVALNTLNQIQGNNVILSSEQQVMLHQLLANTYEAIGNTMLSIDQRSQLVPLLKDPQAQRINLISIWHSLQTLSQPQLTQFLNSNPAPEIKGWVSLALIIKESKTPNELVDNLRQWKSQYPNHPALSLLPKNIEQEVNQTSELKNIALLLPLKGRLRTTGEAIRNGFLAAYYSAEKHRINMPHLKIYNTSGKDINAVYQQALQNGANFVIGPLLKNNLQKLINSGEVTVPTLALNTLADTPQDNKNLFQFGLSPLDEAQQAADRAWKQGDRNAVIIAANSEWGQNIAKVFTQTWTNLGGTIINQTNIDKNTSLSNQVGQLLGINLANQDYTQLKRLLHTNIRFLPRRRNDIDVVYLVAQPAYARQITPLLKYFYAGSIPVYSISQIYTGTNNTKADHDYNGIFFCDMPWVLTPSKESHGLKKLRAQIETIWPLSYSHHKKLYALGIDAFKITTKLQEMEALPQFAIRGATGDLYLDQAQHIYRQLPWARFKNGYPVLLN